LLSLEEARSRALANSNTSNVNNTQDPTAVLANPSSNNGVQLGVPANISHDQQYIEVGGGPSTLPQKYHTVIEIPGSR